MVELVNFELDGFPLSTEEDAVPTPVTDMILCSDEFDIFCEEIDCASVERLWSGPLGWFFLAGSFSTFLWFFVNFTIFYSVFMDNTGFYLISLGFTRYDWVLLGLTRHFVGFTGFQWVLLGFTGVC